MISESRKASSPAFEVEYACTVSLRYEMGYTDEMYSAQLWGRAK